MKIKKKTLLLIPALLVLMLVWAAPAQAGGSDSPTPYTVTKKGIQLPDGHVFEDNGHVNATSKGETVNLHLESKCIERTDNECEGVRHEVAQFIGQSFIPWEVFGWPPVQKT